MAWTTYTEPIEVLNANDLNNIMDNIREIDFLLQEKGISVEAISSVVATYETQLIKMFDILSNIEYNLDKISDNSCKSVYYIEPKTIGDYASNKNDIWRWIQILNDMYNILNGNVGKWQYLLCEDGYPTIDEKRILIRGDLIG